EGTRFGHGRVHDPLLPRHASRRPRAGGGVERGAEVVSPGEALVLAVLLGRLHSAGRMGVALTRTTVRETPSQPLPASAEWGPEPIVRRIRSRDGQGDEELIRRFQRGVAVVLRRSGAGPAADDLSQETFALAIRKIREGEVRQPERLAGFLCSLARNLAIEHFRRASAQRAVGVPDEEAPSGAASPLDDLLRAERAARVRMVLAELPSDRDRDVLN